MSGMARTDAPSRTDVTRALEHLASALRDTTLTLPTPLATEAERVRIQLLEQLEDYVLPRLGQMEAPLLMVVGGSTGAGKSTLVNSLVGEDVTASGVLRPTTRAPVLACHPDDLPWFADDRILPSFPRTSGGSAGAGGLQLVPTERLPQGIALLDAPDIDSVVETNRVLATQLLGAADSWLFVTTAARYADAVPWDLLEAARERGTTLSLVLDRVPVDAADDIRDHLVTMLDERGLADTPVLVVPEVQLEDGRLPAGALGPVRAWLDDLAADAHAREGVVERTLAGALRSIPGRVTVVHDAITEQDRLRAELATQVERAYATALAAVDETVRSGALLRGEVLARWHDVIGTGDLMQALESRIGRFRDRVRAFVSGTAPAESELKAAVVTGVDAVVISAADAAAERAADAWRATAAGRSLLDHGRRLDAASPGLVARIADEVRAWQGEVLELVREEGAGKRATARLASFGINATGLTVMIAVFASTGGLTGAEVVVAGGTSAVGQKVLEAVFGDQAVRTLAERARVRLMERVGSIMDTEAERFAAVLDAVVPPSVASPALAAASAELAATR
ncbi:MAG: putative transporter [Thermoleophilia bacterium]|nr:putative transporter [Thermoleophilia bacterium]